MGIENREPDSGDQPENPEKISVARFMEIRQILKNNKVSPRELFLYSENRDPGLEAGQPENPGKAPTERFVEMRRILGDNNISAEELSLYVEALSAKSDLILGDLEGFDDEPELTREELEQEEERRRREGE